MQTFLPYPDFYKTAQVLDYRRLGKQRIEAKQILMILLDEAKTKGWRNHPAVLMWKGYERALAGYGYEICMEWRKRGYIDNQRDYFRDRMHSTFIPKTIMPPWIGDEKFHLAHRSNLMRKDSKYYKQYFGNIDPTMEYVWPTKLNQGL